MTSALRLLSALTVLVLVADLGVLAERADDRRPPPSARADAVGVAAAPDLARDAASRFLTRFVEPDGRVVRHDQASDTVSEGQAYAMLLAVAVDDRGTFDRVWEWTTRHLQRPDGLLAWRWAAGAIVDPQPAADADLDAAWALARAAERWPDGAYDAAAGRLAAAVDAHETGALPDGRPVLVPGPWARERAAAGRGLVLNPSYSSPAGEAFLVEAGHLPAGRSAARLATMRAVIGQLVEHGGVPTDWVVVAPDGTVHSTAGPERSEAGHFGWDAARVPLRLGTSCVRDDRTLAADLWPAFVAGAGTEAMGDHPARLVAAAAAAAAAGHRDRATDLLERASRADARAPTYYGGALTALGWTLLTTDRLGACGPLR